MKKLIFSIFVLVSSLTLGLSGLGCIPGIPTVDYFNVEPANISSGESATLKWSVSEANLVSIDHGIGNVALNGERVITPDATTIYVLTASNAIGSTTTASVQIVVSGVAPPAPASPTISFFTANPPNISAGGTSTLSWSVSNATSISINPEVGPVNPVGTASVSPAATTNYSLTASNASGANSSTATVTVSGQASLADLIIATGSPSVSPSTVAAGNSVTLSSWTVKNNGTANAGPFSNGFYLSNDSVITTSDTYITGNSNSGLAPGAEFDWGGPSLTIPGGTPPGNYYIGILVDRNNSVSELNENNNYVVKQITVTGGVIIIPLPDLTITTGNPTVSPSSVTAGNSVTLSSWKVKNNGTASTGPFSNGFYLSNDSVITSSDTYITGNSNSGLAPGAEFSWGGPSLTIPGGTPPGNYYIGILVDRNNSVSELNENNNYVAKQITVTGLIIISLPDLTITTGSPTVFPSSVTAGNSVSLSSWTVKNNGTANTGPFSNGFYLSNDSVITSSDTYITGNSNSGLAPGAQFNWGGPSLTIPGGTPPGNYYIGILVDRNNSVFELNENNNYVAKKITVN